jgi:hypothetical protein
VDGLGMGMLNLHDDQLPPFFSSSVGWVSSPFHIAEHTQPDLHVFEPSGRGEIRNGTHFSRPHLTWITI